ncbi:hypothetical protein LMG29739_01653 [Paraburkholderia solisilvae]|uniref:HEPN AbiU2-like domain-containing protein n=2 Tax=Paraburkholderia solisilvae TaxID=624376 RepID=A0A6J5DIM3_9BURK|nr:hypothetical protein LMG29739_01653 [Paraburkholderia solisilvae]
MPQPQPHPVETHIQIVWAFVRLVMLKRVLHEVLPNTRVDFWRIMQGASLDYGLIEWCKVFGNYHDDTHWTKLVPSNRHDDFRKGLHAAVGRSADEWDAYHTEMKEYRDQLAAHHDLTATLDNFPSFDAALEAAYFYYADFLYPTWVADHPNTRYPADMKAFAVGYRDDLLKIGNVAAQATKQFES